MQFYYALKTTLKGTLQAEALPLSSLKITKVQPLGKLGDFEIGVIHATWEDKLGQLIALNVSLSNQNNSQTTWQVAPMRQIQSPNGTNEFHPAIKQNGHFVPLNFSGVLPTFLLCNSGHENYFALLKSYIPNSPTLIQPVYFQVDSQAVVTMISPAEFGRLYALPFPTSIPNGGATITPVVVPSTTPILPSPTALKDYCT